MCLFILVQIRSNSKESKTFYAKEQVSEWLFSSANSFPPSYIMARTSYFQWDDDEVRFVLDKLA
jgi:hypothetical protein